MMMLKSSAHSTVYAGLQVLHSLSFSYEYGLNEMRRRPLHDTIDKTFSVLIQLVNSIINNLKDANEDSFHMLYLVCKIFYVVNHLRMCPHLMQTEPDRLGPWMQFFKSILDMPIPAVLGSFTDDTN